jgi:bacillolysin
MRISRVASILPMFVLLAGCATEESGPETDESIFAGNDQDTLQYAGELALAEAMDRSAIFEGVGDMSVKRVLIDEEGRAHARLAQSVEGIEVFEGEAIIQLGKDGKFDNVIDHFQRDLKLNQEPKIDAKEALAIAIDEFGGDEMIVGESKIDMQIVRGQGIDHTTYRVQLDMRNEKDEPTMPVVFVDAHTKQIVHSFDNLETVRSRKTYTANNGSSVPGMLLRSEGQAEVADAVANQAHDNAGLVYDYYWNTHKRDSYNGAGATITSTVHYSSNYVNAYWSGTQMVYGDGNGTQSGPLTVLDVVGHEITHAVTTSTSNLTYSKESGALNEAMSDIFGARIEAERDGAVSENTWRVGEECWTPATPGDSLRNMANPSEYGDYDYYPTRYTGTQDNGGVHWNSGIANLAFKLAVTGGTHPKSKTTIVVPALDANSLTAIDMGAKIFYRANVLCFTSGSTFLAAANCTIQAANDLYGAGAQTSILQAWKAVGVNGSAWNVLGTQSNLSAAKNVQLKYTFVVPAGVTSLKVNTQGSNGNANLYVRKGTAPTTTTYDCRSNKTNNSNEECLISTGVTAGATYHVMINAASAFSGLTYTASGSQ